MRYSFYQYSGHILFLLGLVFWGLALYLFVVINPDVHPMHHLMRALAASQFGMGAILIGSHLQSQARWIELLEAGDGD